MALLFYDGFDHYTTATQKWDALDIRIGNSGLNSAYARLGGQGGQGFRSQVQPFVDSNTYTILTKAITNRTTVVVGVAFYLYAWPFDGMLLQLRDTVTNQIDVRIDASRGMYATRNATVVIPSAGATALALQRWYFLEVKVVVNPGSTGYVELRLDGTTRGTFTGNTSATGSININRVVLGTQIPSAPNGQQEAWFDDIYVLEADSGSGVVDFLGDCRVQMLLPSGSGTTTQLNRGGTQPSNWQSVNEIPPDTATTVYGNTAGMYDTYDYPPLVPATNRVIAVAQSFIWQRDDAGPRTATARVRFAGNEADFAAPVIPLTNTYAIQQQIQETSPISGSAWALSEVNNFEVGPKVAT